MRKKNSLRIIYFNDAALTWLRNLMPQLKESTTSKYMNILNHYLIPAFGGKRIDRITYAEVYSFSMNLLSNGGMHKKGLSAKTINGIISVLRSIFVFAGNRYEISLPDIKNFYIKQPIKPLIVLTMEEQNTLSRYLLKNTTPCNIGILLCLYTGIRIGEICALKWKNISIAEKTLFIHQSMQRIQTNDPQNKSRKTKIVITSPKSPCSTRRIPIPEEILTVLESQIANGEAFVLTGQCNKYLEPRTLENRYKAVLKSCGIRDVKFHTLRHTFATRCIELGFDIKCLSEILGHASVNITLNRYVHPSMRLKQDNMNKLSVLLNSEK